MIDADPSMHTARVNQAGSSATHVHKPVETSICARSYCLHTAQKRRICRTAKEAMTTAVAAAELAAKAPDRPRAANCDVMFLVESQGEGGFGFVSSLSKSRKGAWFCVETSDTLLPSSSRSGWGDILRLVRASTALGNAQNNEDEREEQKETDEFSFLLAFKSVRQRELLKTSRHTKRLSFIYLTGLDLTFRTSICTFFSQTCQRVDLSFSARTFPFCTSVHSHVHAPQGRHRFRPPMSVAPDMARGWNCLRARVTGTGPPLIGCGGGGGGPPTIRG